jgi:hypothetical protein
MLNNLNAEFSIENGDRFTAELHSAESIGARFNKRSA